MSVYGLLASPSNNYKALDIALRFLQPSDARKVDATCALTAVIVNRSFNSIEYKTYSTT